jgi:hypothetical protein
MVKEKLSKSVVNDLINIQTGSSKNARSVQPIWFFLRYMAMEIIDKNLMDDILRLFVVLYLKSSTAVKLTLTKDLEDIFALIKREETKLFVDGAFKYSIFFYGIS